MENSVLARNVLLMSALDGIASAAAGKGLDLVVLKGAALLYEGLRPMAAREMTDLDLLIRPGNEKAFDELMTASGFVPMENSSQAYYRTTGGGAPPVVVDIHTGLWHERDTAALWHRSRFLSGGAPPERGEEARLKGLGFEDQFLHLASHPLLYHGEMTPRCLEDLSVLLERIYAGTDRGSFWLKAAEIARAGGLGAVVYPVLRRLRGLNPGLISGDELSSFRPRGTGTLLGLFFERAARGHSRRMEYLLPGLYRPGLFFRYMFPGRTFMERRYGKDSAGNRLKRAFRLVRALLGKD